MLIVCVLSYFAKKMTENAVFMNFHFSLSVITSPSSPGGRSHLSLLSGPSRTPVYEFTIISCRLDASNNSQNMVLHSHGQHINRTEQNISYRIS